MCGIYFPRKILKVSTPEKGKQRKELSTIL